MSSPPRDDREMVCEVIMLMGGLQKSMAGLGMGLFNFIVAARDASTFVFLKSMHTALLGAGRAIILL